MLRCGEVTQLCASDAVRSAPLRKRLALRFHLLMCRHCRRYLRELRAIAQAVRNVSRAADAQPEDHEALIERALAEGRDHSS